MKITWVMSTDAGRTWALVDVRERSYIAGLATTGELAPGEIHDDGYGHLYRYEVR